MKEMDNLELDSKKIGALPIINSFLQPAGLMDLLAECLVSRKNQKLSHADAIVLFVRNSGAGRDCAFGTE